MQKFYYSHLLIIKTLKIMETKNIKENANVKVNVKTLAQCQNYLDCLDHFTNKIKNFNTDALDEARSIATLQSLLNMFITQINTIANNYDHFHHTLIYQPRHHQVYFHLSLEYNDIIESIIDNKIIKDTTDCLAYHYDNLVHAINEYLAKTIFKVCSWDGSKTWRNALNSYNHITDYDFGKDDSNPDYQKISIMQSDQSYTTLMQNADL